MGAHAHCPVALVKLGRGWIQAVHTDGRAKVEIG